MDLWHQISFEIPELHSMLLFVAYSSFSPEVKIPAEVGITRLSGFSSPPSARSPTCASTKTLRLHVHSLISYFWGKEILPEHFKQDYTLRNKKGGGGRKRRRRDEAGACVFVLWRAWDSQEKNRSRWWGMWDQDQPCVCVRARARRTTTEQRCCRPACHLRLQSRAE